MKIRYSEGLSGQIFCPLAISEIWYIEIRYIEGLLYVRTLHTNFLLDMSLLSTEGFKRCRDVRKNVGKCKDVRQDMGSLEARRRLPSRRVSLCSSLLVGLFY